MPRGAGFGHKRLVALGPALVAALAALGASSPCAATPQEFLLDPANTHVHWEIQHFGTSTIRGRFDTIEGSVTLDREARRGSASMRIATASVSTGFGPFDGIVRGPFILSTAQNPSAYFVAEKFVFDGDRVASVTGEFTLRGVSQALTLRALRFACRVDGTPERETCGGDFEAELKRSEFGITYALPFVAERVRLQIQIEAVRQ